MVTVRPAVPYNDQERLAEVALRSWRAAYQGLFPLLERARNVKTWEDAVQLGVADSLPPSTPLYWRTLLVRSSLGALPPERNSVFVADHQDDGVVGYLIVGRYGLKGDEEHPGEHVGELGALYVLSDHWRMGAGGLLVDTAIELLVECGFREALLWVLHGNVRARRFYETRGWKFDGATRLRQLYGSDTYEVRYRRVLRRD